MAANRDAENNLTLTCDRCGRSEGFVPYADESNRFTDDDEVRGILPTWKMGDWFWLVQEAYCAGCVTEADRREANGLCARCGKEPPEDADEMGIAENVLDPDGYIQICESCYTDEDRRWGQEHIYEREED
jgi:hypothetical protein